MKRLCFLFLFFISVYHFSQGQIVINEIMYHAPNNEIEYIELYNPSSQSHNLSGWILKDNLDSHSLTFPPESTIEPYGYLLLTNNEDLFYSTYAFHADITGVSFNFSNTGDSVRLFDANQVLIEYVEYDDRTPWPEIADGSGPSLERRNHLIPAHVPSAWAASTNNGTPGERNSSHVNRLEPLIFNLDHNPKIPQPYERITLSVRILDPDGEIESVKVYYGWNRGSTYQSVDMFDDGRHDDQEIDDGIYAANIPGRQAGDVLRFYLEATDNNNQTSYLPAEGGDNPYLTAVENQLRDESVSILRVAMRPEVNQQFLARYQTDEYFPATFYDGDTVYYRVYIRHRGRSRSQNGRFKIRFPHHDLYRGKIRRLNFNGTDSSTILKEYLSYQLYQDAGLPNLESELVRFHINGVSTRGTPYRIAIENPDSQFLRRRHYFQNDDGNLYKTTLDGTPDNKATWRYVGENPDLYRSCYIKQTNEAEDDFTDIIRFCRVLSQANTFDPNYLDQVYSVLNPENLLRWMAVSACVAHWDSPYTDHGHNYVLYNNPSTNQFNIIAWDLNGTFNYSSNHNDLNYRKHYTHIRSTKFPAINKILNHPVFGARYYREIDGLLNYLFTQETMDKRIDEARDALKLNDYSVRFLRTYVTQRIEDLSQWINREQGMAFVSKPVYQATVNEFYTYHCVATDYRNNQTLTYSLNQAPDWLTINSSTGILTGNPPTEGKYNVVIGAKSQLGEVIQQPFILQAVDAKPRLIMNFNDSSTSPKDLSDYQQTASLRGNVRRLEGRLGNAVSVSPNSYVHILHNDSLNLTGSITVEAWIRPNTISNGNPVIITKGNADIFNYKLMLGYGPWSWDNMEPCFMPHRFDIRNRVYYGRKEIEAQLRGGQWVHIAGTYDSGTERIRVYSNNRRIVDSSTRPRMETNSNPLMIGLNNSQSFRGAIDDVKILHFAKQTFAAGLCLSHVDVSRLSSAQERVSLSLSEYRDESINTENFCLYLVNANEWIPLPDRTLSPGQSQTFWLDNLGLEQAMLDNETLCLYPTTSLGNHDRQYILDQVVWGDQTPDWTNPGVRAALWLPEESVQISNDEANSLFLKNFTDNDDMHLDWQVQSQQLLGPKINSFTINNGEEETQSHKVQLNIITEETNTSMKMRVSNTPAMPREWMDYSQNIQWTLTPNNGQKTVYIQLKNNKNQRSPVIKETIRLNANTQIYDWKNLE